MQHASGIVAGIDGTYYYATMTHRKSGWISGSVRRSRSTHVVRAILQVSAQPCLGASSHWKSANSKIGLPQYFTSTTEKLPFVACVDTNVLQQLTKEFGEYATAIIPDDAFLATLPLIYTSSHPDTFGTLYKTSDRFIVGLVRHRVLTSVYSLPSSDVDACMGLLDRISRFERGLFADDAGQRISRFYCIGADSLCLNNLSDESGYGYSFVKLSLPGFIDDSDEMTVRAFGCAAAQIVTTAVPQFVFSPVSARLSNIRAMIYRITAVLVACTLICSLGAWLHTRIADNNYRTARQTFESIIVRDSAISQLIRTNDSLVQQLSTFKSGSSVSTRWTEVLNVLDSIKPEGLFVENMATEPGRPPQNCNRIAISGRAPDAALVYDLVDRLQKQTLFLQIAVSSVEQIGKTGDMVQFKIIGTLACQNQ